MSLIFFTKKNPKRKNQFFFDKIRFIPQKKSIFLDFWPKILEWSKNFKISDVYALEKLDKDVVKHVQSLRGSLGRELEVQKMISSLIGSIDLIVSTTKMNVKSSSTALIEDNDVFGEPTIRARDLDELKPSDQGAEEEYEENMQINWTLIFWAEVEQKAVKKLKFI